MASENKTTEPPKRIPARGGGEMDAFSRWRHVLCYMARPGVCQSMKRAYNRRLRRITRIILKDAND